MIQNILHFLFSKEQDFALKNIEGEEDQSFHNAQNFEFLCAKAPQLSIYTPSHIIKLNQTNSDQRNAMWHYLNAALKGHAQAQYKLGLSYLEGDLGTDRNYRYAEQWLMKAKQQGYQPAANALAKAYSQLAL